MSQQRPHGCHTPGEAIGRRNSKSQGSRWRQSGNCAWSAAGLTACWTAEFKEQLPRSPSLTATVLRVRSRTRWSASSGSCGGPSRAGSIRTCRPSRARYSRAGGLAGRPEAGVATVRLELDPEGPDRPAHQSSSRMDVLDWYDSITLETSMYVSSRCCCHHYDLIHKTYAHEPVQCCLAVREGQPTTSFWFSCPLSRHTFSLAIEVLTGYRGRTFPARLQQGQRKAVVPLDKQAKYQHDQRTGNRQKRHHR